MKKVLIGLSAVLFCANSFAGFDANQIHSAIQNGFHGNTLNSQQSAITYGGKDISQPKVAIADENPVPISFSAAG